MQPKLHPALPQSKTVEALAVWIKENSIEQRWHEEKIDYTPEEIQKFEHLSAKVSIELDELKAVHDTFKQWLKKGTVCIDKETQKFEDQVVRIPGTKGTDALEANRDYASRQIKLGYKVEKTELFGIPYSTDRKIIFFDIEGREWDQYSYKMNPHQVEQYGNPLFDEKRKSVAEIAKDFHEGLADAGMKVTKVQGNEVTIESTGKKKKTPPAPTEEEQHLFDT